MTGTITLNGHGITPSAVVAISKGAKIALAEVGLARMARTHAALQQAIDEGRPMYGITTGLGPRVVERLSAAEQAAMSLNTLRGRAHAVGTALPFPVIRAALAIRVNTLLLGAAGTDPALADMMVACLNAGLTPIVRETGSIGAADLMWAATMGLAVVGEGMMDTADGPRPAATALAMAGIEPYRPGPREGLALASHSSVTVALAALGLCRLRCSLESAQTAAALTLEGFRANLTPFDPRVLDLHPQPGQAKAARGILDRLAGSDLTRPGQARRVQDPLSLRNIAQLHGVVFAALETAEATLDIELNGAPDNPAVLADGEVLSTGAYLTPHLTISLGAVTQALTHLAAAQVARMSKQVHPRFTDLPVGLGAGDPASAGFAPAMKTAEALFSEIAQLAAPSPVYPSAAADGVEDVVTHSAIPAKALDQIADRLDRLTAMELMISTQAVELRTLPQIAPVLTRTMATVREDVRPLQADRALSEEIETLAARVQTGAFSAP
ncbi:MAG: histidine ammonia-lyase [Paracoccaceae bacterium]